MLTSNITMTEELQAVFDEVVKPLDGGNPVTVVTLMADGSKYYQEFEDVETGVFGYTNELVWALDNEQYVSEVVCFILRDATNDREPKYLFHAYGFAGTDTDVPKFVQSEEAME